MVDAPDRAQMLEGFLKSMPFAQFIGMECIVRGDEMTAILPFQDKLIGNMALPALHGGAIGAFLELTAMSQVFLLSDGDKPPKPVDLTVDYLRSGKAKDLYARATVTKMGRRITNVRVEAWQDERAKPVAALHAHFLIGDGQGS